MIRSVCFTLFSSGTRSRSHSPAPVVALRQAKDGRLEKKRRKKSEKERNRNEATRNTSMAAVISALLATATIATTINGLM